LVKTLTEIFMEALALDDEYVSQYAKELKERAYTRFTKLVSEGFVHIGTKSAKFINECNIMCNTMSHKYVKFMNEDTTDSAGISANVDKYLQYVRNESLEIPDIIKNKVADTVISEMENMNLEQIFEESNGDDSIISERVKSEILTRKQHPSLFESISYTVKSNTDGDNVLDVFNESVEIYTTYETLNTLNILKSTPTEHTHEKMIITNEQIIDESLTGSYVLSEYSSKFNTDLAGMLNSVETPGLASGIMRDIVNISEGLRNGNHLYNLEVINPLGWLNEVYAASPDNSVDDAISMLENISLKLKNKFLPEE